MITNLNTQNFQEETKGEIPVIIDFWASWCGPCQMMGPVFEELSKEYTGKLKFAKVDTETNSEIPNMFGIQGIPCLVVVHDGKEVDRIVGFVPKEVLKEKIDSILKKI